MVQRQDGWMEADDKILAEEVLKRIREGETQLSAFQEAAKLLNRTASACGFRWNSALRKPFAEEIQKAKLERKERKARRMQPLGTQLERLSMNMPTEAHLPCVSECGADEAVTFGKAGLHQQLQAVQRGNEELLQWIKVKYEQVCLENANLKRKLSNMEKDFQLFVLDYQTNYFSKK